MEGGPLRMGGAGSPGLGCAGREDRCVEAGCREGGKLGNGGSPGGQGPQLSPPNTCVHRFLGEPAARKVYLFSILNLEATSQLLAVFRQVIPTTGGGGGSAEEYWPSPVSGEQRRKAAQLGTDPTSPRELRW